MIGALDVEGMRMGGPHRSPSETPLLTRLGGLGERRKLLHRGPGQSPDREWGLVHFELEIAHLVMRNLIFLRTPLQFSKTGYNSMDIN